MDTGTKNVISEGERLQAWEHRPTCEEQEWRAFFCRRDWCISQNRRRHEEKHSVEILKQHYKTSAKKVDVLHWL